MQGRIHSIFIAESANTPTVQLETARLEAGKGIIGDRYHTGTGTFSEMLADRPLKQITLIEKEAVDRFNRKHNTRLDYPELRRNIITEGIRLNPLVGKTFQLGEVTLKGIKLCEPCPHLAEVLLPEVLPGLLGSGGLRCEIITDGALYTGDIFSVAMDCDETIPL